MGFQALRRTRWPLWFSLAWEAWLPSLGASPWAWERVLREGLSRAYLLVGSLVPDQELELGQASGTEGGWVEVSLGPGKDLPFSLVLFSSSM